MADTASHISHRNILCSEEEIQGWMNNEKLFTRGRDEVLLADKLLDPTLKEGGAEVLSECQGTSPDDVYTVHVKFRDGDSDFPAEATCTCPYAVKRLPAGLAMCKHTVALLLWRCYLLQRSPRPTPAAPPPSSEAAVGGQPSAAALPAANGTEQTPATGEEGGCKPGEEVPAALPTANQKRAPPNDLAATNAPDSKVPRGTEGAPGSDAETTGRGAGAVGNGPESMCPAFANASPGALRAMLQIVEGASDAEVLAEADAVLAPREPPRAATHAPRAPSGPSHTDGPGGADRRAQLVGTCAAGQSLSPRPALPSLDAPGMLQGPGPSQVAAHGELGVKAGRGIGQDIGSGARGGQVPGSNLVAAGTGAERAEGSASGSTRMPSAGRYRADVGSSGAASRLAPPSSDIGRLLEDMGVAASQPVAGSTGQEGGRSNVQPAALTPAPVPVRAPLASSSASPLTAIDSMLDMFLGKAPQQMPAPVASISSQAGKLADPPPALRSSRTASSHFTAVPATPSKQMDQPPSTSCLRPTAADQSLATKPDPTTMPSLPTQMGGPKKKVISLRDLGL